VFRGPGALDPSGRITRGVSTIREPLPLLANLVGVTLSPGASDNGTVDILPATTSSRAASAAATGSTALPTGPTAWC